MECAIHECACAACRSGDHPEKEDHRYLNLILSRLDEQQRRWVAGREARRRGHGGVQQVAEVVEVGVVGVVVGAVVVGVDDAFLLPPVNWLMITIPMTKITATIAKFRSVRMRRRRFSAASRASRAMRAFSFLR